MIRNYIIIAFRNLGRNKLLSMVNIAGLSIGLACVMLIMLFVNDEFSFDKFQANGNRLFRLVSVSTDSSGMSYASGITGIPQGPSFTADIPGIEAFCRIKGWDMTTKTGANALQAKVLYADTSFFNMFSFKVLKRSSGQLLNGRNSVVLTKAQATKSFGDADPIGKMVDIQVEDKFESFMVTGVVENPPVNSSVWFDMLIPFERDLPAIATDRNRQAGDWNSTFLNTFILLRDGKSSTAVQNKFAQSFLKYNGDSWAQFKKHYGKNVKREYSLQPFLQMHLNSRFNVSNGLSNASDVSHSYVLTALGILILIIACINFVNIMLARSAARSREIGIRKVSGSSKTQLIFQFLTESAVITAIAFAPAVVLVQLFLPVFTELSGKQLEIQYLFQFKVVMLFAGLWALVSLLAGFYPAFVVSGFNPVLTLYGRFKLSGKNTLGKSLVVLQFVIAITLIISTVVFEHQFKFMTKSDQGYKTENIIRVDLPYNKAAETKIIKNELARQPFIEMTGAKAGDYNKTVFTINKKETDWTYYENMDDHYLQVLGIPLVKGRYLSYANQADTVSKCLVNEAFVKTYLDASRDPIGQIIGGPAMDGKSQMEIVGVVRNYHLNTFKEKIEPVYFALDKQGSTEHLFVKYYPGRAGDAVKTIENLSKKLLPFDVTSYNFLDDYNRHLYATQEQWKSTITYAAFIAILISSLGLFALTTLAASQRVKEIGIRKVLGASITNITAMLSASFLRLVVIAFVIAVPVSWYLMNQWLQAFAYRITLSWWLFLLPVVATLILAFITISYHTIRAAIANPVSSLRSE